MEGRMMTFLASCITMHAGHECEAPISAGLKDTLVEASSSRTDDAMKLFLLNDLSSHTHKIR